MGIEEYSNRNAYDIIADILNACNKPIRKTPLMSRASASKITLDKILKLCFKDPPLLERIVGEEGAVFYHTTSLGAKYLEVYENLNEIVKPRKQTEAIYQVVRT